MPSIQEMLRCRDIGHQWEETWRRTRNAGWGKRRILKCEYCQTERLELIDIKGNVGSRSYEYLVDYKKVSGMNKAEARVERMTRRGRV